LKRSIFHSQCSIIWVFYHLWMSEEIEWKEKMIDLKWWNDWNIVCVCVCVCVCVDMNMKQFEVWFWRIYNNKPWIININSTINSNIDENWRIWWNWMNSLCQYDQSIGVWLFYLKFPKWLQYYHIHMKQQVFHQMSIHNKSPLNDKYQINVESMKRIVVVQFMMCVEVKWNEEVNLRKENTMEITKNSKVERKREILL